MRDEADISGFFIPLSASFISLSAKMFGGAALVIARRHVVYICCDQSVPCAVLCRTSFSKRARIRIVILSTIQVPHLSEVLLERRASYAHAFGNSRYVVAAKDGTICDGPRNGSLFDRMRCSGVRWHLQRTLRHSVSATSALFVASHGRAYLILISAA